MRPPSNQRRGRPGAGIMILASLCVLLLAPGPSRAGCGGATGAHRTSARLDLLTAATGGLVSPQAEPARPIPRCSGPSCSNRVPPPPAGAFEVVPPRGDGLAEARILPIPPSRPRHRRAEDDAEGPLRSPARIFHPPRLPS